MATKDYNIYSSLLDYCIMCCIIHCTDYVYVCTVQYICTFSRICTYAEWADVVGGSRVASRSSLVNNPSRDLAHVGSLAK